MSKAMTRLSLQSDQEGLMNTTLELSLSDGESMRLNFLLPKTQQAPQTIEHIERAMLLRAKTLAEHMLQA